MHSGFQLGGSAIVSETFFFETKRISEDGQRLGVGALSEGQQHRYGCVRPQGSGPPHYVLPTRLPSPPHDSRSERLETDEVVRRL